MTRWRRGGRIIRGLAAVPETKFVKPVSAKHTPGGGGSLSMNLKVGQASRLPSRRSRRQNGLRARALAGQAGRLPYVPGTWPVHGRNARTNFGGFSPEYKKGQGEGKRRFDSQRVSPIQWTPQLIHGNSGLDRVALQIVPNRPGGHQAIFEGAGGGAARHGDDRADELIRARPEVAYHVSAGCDCGGDFGASGTAGVVSYRETRRAAVALHGE